MDFKLKNGKSVLIRETLPTDAKIVIDYMHKINFETKNLLREPDEFKLTIEQEEEYLKAVMLSENECMFSVWDEDKLISVSGFHGSHLNRIKHKVEFGIIDVRFIRLPLTCRSRLICR